MNDTPTPETFLTVSKDELEKMFASAKSNDYTRSMFEREKTERIKALAAIVPALASSTAPNSNTGRTHLENVLEKLYGIHYETFAP